MKGKNLLLGLSYIDRKFVEESENEMVSGKTVQNPPIAMHRTVKKVQLIAAMVALMLFLMGCAWAVLHLRDLKIDAVTYTQNPQYAQDRTKIPATEKTKEYFSMQGIAESSNQKAAKEWYDFLQSYDQDRTLFSKAESFSEPDGYDAYYVYTQEMVDKVDAICEKYGLKVAGEGALLLEQAQDRMEEILGFDSFLKKGAKAETTFSGGRFYECGNFGLDFYVTVGELQEVYVGYSYADKAYLDTNVVVIEEPETAREWNYTTKDGTQLLLVKDTEYGHIFCDREDAFIHIQIGGKLQEVPDMTQKEMESIAEVLNFDLKPTKVKNMKALAAELDALYQAPLPTEDPAEVARREAEYEAHNRHDSFAELIADIRDNEAYFTQYSSNTYVDFWNTMEYCMMDANGDGEEDLLLGRDGMVTSIWTMEDGKTAGLAGSWAQGYLCEGYIYELAVTENGSHYHSYRNLMTKESLGEVSYYPSDGVWHYQKGNEIEELTEAEAFAIMDSYVHLELPDMKSVQEFPMK